MSPGDTFEHSFHSRSLRMIVKYLMILHSLRKPSGFVRFCPEKSKFSTQNNFCKNKTENAFSPWLRVKNNSSWLRSNKIKNVVIALLFKTSQNLIILLVQIITPPFKDICLQNATIATNYCFFFKAKLSKSFIRPSLPSQFVVFGRYFLGPFVLRSEICRGGRYSK